jgi:hypothetical protein
MSKKHREPKFSGALAEPIYPLTTYPLDTPADREKWRERVIGNLLGKLDLLLDHYQLDRSDPNRWHNLSFKLAFDFVPGMKIEATRPPGPGRKRTWQAGLGADLLSAVNRTVSERSIGIEAAIAHLRKSDPKWRSFTTQNLAARLREARRRDRLHKRQIAELLANTGPILLADLGKVSSPPVEQGRLTGGLFGLGESVLRNRRKSEP